jgi:hypothetical protein
MLAKSGLLFGSLKMEKPLERTAIQQLLKAGGKPVLRELQKLFNAVLFEENLVGVEKKCPILQNTPDTP